MTEQDKKRQCEVAYWVRFATRNRNAWAEAKERLIKKRGKQAVDELVKEMEAYREAARG